LTFALTDWQPHLGLVTAVQTQIVGLQGQFEAGVRRGALRHTTSDEQR
jgi:hypothetical protein